MLRDIFNTYRQAFRVFVRQRTRPLSYEEAEEKKLLWSKVYVMCGILSMLGATYITGAEGINFSYRKDIGKEEAVIEALSSTSKIKVVKFQNLQKIDEYEFSTKTNQTESNNAQE